MRLSCFPEPLFASRKQQRAGRDQSRVLCCIRMSCLEVDCPSGGGCQASYWIVVQRSAVSEYPQISAEGSRRDGPVVHST